MRQPNITSQARDGAGGRGEGGRGGGGGGGEEEGGEGRRRGVHELVVTAG